MEDTINLLLLKNIGHYLENENLEYLVRKEQDFYKIDKIPILFKGHMSSLSDFLAYDYDLLNEEHQNKYRLLYQKYKKNNGKYYLETKQYIKKK